VFQCSQRNPRVRKDAAGDVVHGALVVGADRGRSRRRLSAGSGQNNMLSLTMVLKS
jgi:hypothetical protein